MATDDPPAAPEPAPAPRTLSRGRAVAFGVLTFVCFLLALELGLQLWAAWQGPQGHFVDDQALPEPQADAIRVLAVGDSWVFGAEAEPDEAFIEVFAAGLRQETGRPVQVFNLGVPATNSAQALVAMHGSIERVQPDWVVTMTGANNLMSDLAVGEAARLMGEDARLLPGFALLSRSRLVRLLRLIWVTVIAPPPPVEEGSAPDLFAAIGADPTGGAGLPHAPQVAPPEVPPLPWFELYRQRRWDAGLARLEATPLPADEDRYRGLQASWRALFLAHLKRFDQAEVAAAEGLRRGGDDAAAWEARAVVSELQDRSMDALKARLREANVQTGAGFPWLITRARGLALLELEAWEAAETWLLAANGAVGGDLETLVGIARLPGATRGEAAEQALFGGPRGAVTATEFFDWHLTSSGSVERAVASLSSVDPGESAELEVYRGRAAALQGDVKAARAWFLGVLGRSDARALDAGRALGWLAELAASVDELREQVGSPGTATVAAPLGMGWPHTASSAPALASLARRSGDCETAIAVGRVGLLDGMGAKDFEQAIADCLPQSVAWSLTEQVLADGPILDRAALVLGLRAGSLPGRVPAPSVPGWELFAERRFVEFMAVAPADWRALAIAHLEDLDQARRRLDEAAAAGDPAVIAWGRSLVHRRAGEFLPAFFSAVEAAEAEGGDPWIRTVARGVALVDALRWSDAQKHLLAALRPAPGYLEALEALAQVPQAVRLPAAELALRYVPSGAVPAHRWAAWYAAQDRFEEAMLALDWPRSLTPDRPGDDLRRALEAGRILAADGQAEAALLAFDRAVRLAELQSRHTAGCRALAARARALGTEAPIGEVAVLSAACPEHPEALGMAGSVATLHKDCDRSTEAVWLALEAGEDPAEVVDWMDPCVGAQELDEWLQAEGRRRGLSLQASSWIWNRVHPNDLDEPSPPAARVASRSNDQLVRHLDAMAGLARSESARFVVLTYPFPGAHHRRVRDRLVEAAPKADFELLDVYGVFESRYDPAEWQAMRTPQDHVNAEGYRAIGEALLAHVRARP